MIKISFFCVLLIAVVVSAGCDREYYYRLTNGVLHSNDNLLAFEVHKITGNPDSILNKDRSINKTVFSPDFLLVTPDTSMVTDGSRKFSLTSGKKGYDCFYVTAKDTVQIKSPEKFFTANGVYLISGLYKKRHQRLLILFRIKQNGRISKPEYFSDL